jgi:hypothetical protein
MVIFEEDEGLVEETETFGRAERKRYWKQRKLVAKRKEVVEVSEEEEEEGPLTLHD